MKDDYDALIYPLHSLKPEMTFKDYMYESMYNKITYLNNEEKFKNYKKLKDLSFEEFKKLTNELYLESTNTIPGQKNYIGASSCSYLANLFVIFNNYKFILIGTGLGSHKKNMIIILWSGIT